MAKTGYSEADLFKDPPRAERWVTEREAREWLGVPEGELISWDYIETERHGESEKWVQLLPETAAALIESGKLVIDGFKVKTKKNRGKPADPGAFAARERVASSKTWHGEKPIWITNEEAALRMRITVAWFKKGWAWKLEGKWAGGERLVLLQAVEAILGARAEKRERSRERARERKYGKVAGGVGRWGLGVGEEVTEESTGGREGEEDWVVVREAAGYLGVTPAAVKRLIYAGKLVWRWRRKRLMEVAFSSIRAELERREREMERRSIPAKEFEYYYRKPVLRSTLEAPPGDRLISRMEAAKMLGVHVSTVSRLVMKGRLFGWQREVGKKGSLFFLSYNQVLRYSREPGRIRRKERWERAQGNPRARGEMAGFPEEGIPAYDLYAAEGNALKDHGEYYSTRQVAQLLGITVEAVRNLVKRRRLTGYRRPIEKGRYERRRWWFYRKEEVHALMHDPERLKFREAYRKSVSVEGRAEQLSRQVRVGEYVPHDPLNVLKWPRGESLESAADLAAGLKDG